MTERPVLFKGEMVLRVLDDSKTHTRRVPTSANTLVDGKRVSPKAWKAIDFDWRRAQCVEGPCILVPEKRKRRRLRLSPVWQVGDHLWVRETWRPMGNCFRVKYGAQIKYRAGGDTCWRSPRGPDGVWRNMDDASFRDWLTGKFLKWRPSIHMPRWSSRSDLEVRSMRAERVQEITWQDIRAEGVSCPEHDGDGCFCASECASLRSAWRELWDSINAPRGWGWDTNRPVWVAGFKRINP